VEARPDEALAGAAKNALAKIATASPDDLRDRRNGIIARVTDKLRASSPFVRREAAPFLDAGMRLRHESVEMDAAFVLHPRAGEEQIHQSGFSSPHIAMDVEALQRLARPCAGEEPEQARLPWTIGLQRAIKRLKSCCRARLLRIRLKFAGLQQGVIAP